MASLGHPIVGDRAHGREKHSSTPTNGNIRINDEESSTLVRSLTDDFPDNKMVIRDYVSMHRNYPWMDDVFQTLKAKKAVLL